VCCTLLLLMVVILLSTMKMMTLLLVLLLLLRRLLLTMPRGAAPHHKLLRQLLHAPDCLALLALAAHLQTTAAQLPVLHGDRHCCCWLLGL
jgi:hypothetical protein